MNFKPFSSLGCVASVAHIAFGSLLLASQAVWAAGPLPTTNPADLKPLRPGILPGYMAAGSWVDSLALLPPPPAVGSAALAADQAAYQATRVLKDTPRWALAEKDAELSFPKAASTYACALGVNISAEATPHLNMLLRRTLADAGLATYRAKDNYKRTRPFMVANDAICTPSQEEALRKDGSYPSGHASLGWAWALILTEVAPERANALIQRGHAFAQSRAICGVHWQSDVQAGMLVGAGVVAQLHNNADFNAQLGAARLEVAAARANNATNATPAQDCAAEAAALAR